MIVHNGYAFGKNTQMPVSKRVLLAIKSLETIRFQGFFLPQKLPGIFKCSTHPAPLVLRYS